jgi:hypothetical protein
MHGMSSVIAIVAATYCGCHPDTANSARNVRNNRTAMLCWHCGASTIERWCCVDTVVPLSDNSDVHTCSNCFTANTPLVNYEHRDCKYCFRKHGSRYSFKDMCDVRIYAFGANAELSGSVDHVIRIDTARGAPRREGGGRAAVLQSPQSPKTEM